jgi:hypothetical protein
MNKYLNMLIVVMLLMVTALNVAAEDFDNEAFGITSVTIENVEFDSEDIAEGEIFAPVYLDSMLEVVVEWKGDENLSETIEAKIEVEFDGEDQDTEYFDVKANHIGATSVFEIEIDDDEDLVGIETLTVTMKDKEGNFDDVEVVIRLDIVKEDNLVEIYDVNFRNGLQLNAGEVFIASVGISNEGYDKEDDVYVKMSIPELGLTTRTDRFDLYTDRDANEEEYSKFHKQLFMQMPLNVPSGVYDVYFTVYFDDGDEAREVVYSLIVGSGQAYDSQITMDSEYQVTSAGKAIVYKVLFANPNVDYNVVVEGLDFGTYEVRTEDNTAYVFVSVDEDASNGEYAFNVVVKAGSNVLEDFAVTTKVTEGNSDVSYSSVKQGLEIGFAVLLVILVILGIILVAKRLGKGDEIEEPMLDEDQTYY